MNPDPDPGARPEVLICSGLDPSGGAGFLADARVVHELGGRPVGVVTCLTVQATTGVVSARALDPETIRDQLELLLTDVEVRAVKIGIIGSSEIARSIAAALALTSAPVVWDPVLFPSRGDVVLADGELSDAIAALAPHLTLLTPNTRELAILGRRTVTDLETSLAAAADLSTELDTAVLVKGGHLGGDLSTDVLVRHGQRDELRATRIPGGEAVHGTGCALSSAIAVNLAHGTELLDACQQAKRFVATKIAHPVRPGRGAPAVV